MIRITRDLISSVAWALSDYENVFVANDIFLGGVHIFYTTQDGNKFIQNQISISRLAKIRDITKIIKKIKEIYKNEK